MSNKLRPGRRKSGREKNIKINKNNTIRFMSLPDDSASR